MRRVVMNDENRCSSGKEPIGRITRARAKTLGLSSAGLPPLHPCTKKNDKPRANLKRAAPDSSNEAASCTKPKKRAVLKDVTNVTREQLNINCIDASKDQPRKQDKKYVPIQTKANSVPTCFVGKPEFPGDKRGDMIEETNNIKVQESLEIGSAENLTNLSSEIIITNVSAAAGLNAFIENHNFFQKEESLEERGITDIDLEHRDPKMCSMYAADIYSSLHAVQLNRRPSSDYMEKLQNDITQGMRSILIDWLVEVSEEYRLVPDTLYLTVNLIDRFLSENYVDKKRLQLLGVTCMLIASKYEEICPPRVEDLCFITDNTYTKEEVVKMESHVLNLLDFHLSVPTTKKFLRRFIQAAQVSYAVPSVELEFLANYLAELSLIEYSFLKFLPSLIAASAVFLARWTLDQSEHPWNQTLEHYTRYKTFELKHAVLELHDLQLNTSKSMLNVIRIKYRQSKFRSVSNLRSPKPVQSLF